MNGDDKMKKKRLIIFIVVILLATACETKKEEDKKYYDFGMPTIESQTNYQNVIESSGSNTFVKLEGEKLSICIYKNNKLECFEYDNYEEESVHIQNVFGDDKCDPLISSVSCYDGVFRCVIRSNRVIQCFDTEHLHNCYIDIYGNAVCY